MIFTSEKTRRTAAFFMALALMLQTPAQVLAGYGFPDAGYEFLNGDGGTAGYNTAATESGRSASEQKTATGSSAAAGAKSGTSISDSLYWAYAGGKLLITTAVPSSGAYQETGTLDAREPDYDAACIPWSGLLTEITEVTVGGVSSEDTVTPYYMNGWFDGLENVTEITFRGIDTSRTRSFTALFRSCDRLEELDLSAFNTKNALDMSEMFKDCHSLRNIEFGSFNTEKVTDYDEMFMNCTGLSSLDLSSFSTAAGTTFVSMFEGCACLEELPVGSFKTTSATDLSCMFKDCELLQNASIAGFDTSKTRYVRGLFQGCISLRTVDLGTVETDLMSDVSSMFEGCESLESLDLSSMKMQYVLYMNAMFKDCRTLKEIDLSDMETLIPVISMAEMFSGCSSLTTVCMTEIDSDYLVSLASMFENCTSLKNLSVLSTANTASQNVLAIDTGSVQDMSRMFYGCDHLENLKLYCNMLYVPEMDDMLTGCVRLQILSKGAQCRLHGYQTESSAGLPSPDSCYIPGASGYWYSKDSTDEYAASELPDLESDAVFRAVYGSVTYYPNGYDVEPVTDYLGFNENYQIRGNVFSDYAKADMASPAWNTSANNTGTSYDVNETYNTRDHSALRSLTLYAQWKTSPRATHSVYWKTDTETLKTDSVVHGTVAEYTGPVPQRDGFKFTGWTPDPVEIPVTEDITFWANFTQADTVTVTWDWDNAAGSTPSRKDERVYELGSMPVYSETPVKTDPDGVYAYVFLGWSPEVTEARKDVTYTAVYSKTYADLLFWDYDAGKLTVSSTSTGGENGGSFRSSVSYTDGTESPWYRYRRLIRKVVIGGEGDEVKPVRMDGWFDGFRNLTSGSGNLDFTGLDTAKADSMKALFRGCEKLTSLDISSWDTSSVTDFEDFLSGCISLTALKLPVHMVTAETRSVKGMFRDLNRVPAIGVSGFNTENVTDFTEMFARCYYLEDLDVSGFRTPQGTLFDGMFEDCLRVKVLDVSGFSTPKGESFAKMFRNCAFVTKLDLGGFRVSAAEEHVKDMFTGMIRLAELKVGTNCNLSEAGVPAPDKKYVQHADGYWHMDGKTYPSSEIKMAGTYSPVYGWITYDPNGRPGAAFTEYLEYDMKNYNIPECGYEPAEGTVFDGWTEEKEWDGSTAIYRVSDTLTKTEYEALFGKTLYAQFKTVEKTTAEIIWKDHDGSVLKKETVNLGSKAKYTGTQPARKNTAQYSYSFSGWNPEPGIVTEDVVYTAVYTAELRTYTVTWYNRDKTIVDRRFDVPYGTTPEHTKIIPTYTSERWNFTFKKWDREPEMVTGDTSYEAVYTVTSKLKYYTIRWVNWDDSLLLQETVLENTKPKGPTTKPVRPETASVTYEFTGWDSNIVKATADRTYKAVYRSTLKSYVLLWNLNGHGQDVSQKLKVGETIGEPADPTAAGYDFQGWYYDEGCTKDPVDFEDLTMPDHALVIYAKWSAQSKPSGGGGGGSGISSADLQKITGEATFSKHWSTNGQGKWVFMVDGTLYRNCWLCDDAVVSNRSDVWYLLKEDGTMLEAGLLQDQTGNYYSLETRHEGYYGMLRYKDGYYDGVWLEFEKEHNGSFGAIKNADGIAELKKKYDVVYVNFGNASCVYTSSFENR